MSDAIEVKEETQGDVLIIRLAGRVDANTAPPLEEQVLKKIDGGQHKVLLDFAGVDYISSAGMRFLLSCTKKVKGVSGKFVICSMSEGVIEVINMAGFNHILNIEADESAAMGKLS
ncbi:MAG: anti-sigma factor antagonist [Chlamydiales bacterium]|nr:STAS domain-containing protein [Chlamydiales bacterium]NCF70316.1 anti-sigma factor antagonist [Chlamydiales bacterium]